MTGIRRECFILYAKEHPGVALGFDPMKSVEVADDFCRTEGLKRPPGVIPVYRGGTLTGKQKQDQAKKANQRLKRGNA
jgi:hypothetical protein